MNRTNEIVLDQRGMPGMARNVFSLFNRVTLCLGPNSFTQIPDSFQAVVVRGRLSAGKTRTQRNDKRPNWSIKRMKDSAIISSEAFKQAVNHVADQ